MWIRSQNKKSLCNPTFVSIYEETKGFTFYVDGEKYEDKIIGRYPTEARALEVLDEIQAHVIGKIIIPNSWNTRNLETYIKNGFVLPEIAYQGPSMEYLPTVYEMPKE